MPKLQKLKKVLKNNKIEKKPQLIEKKKKTFYRYKLEFHDDVILLLGEGNFSFSQSLVNKLLVDPSKCTSTNYDSKEITFQKYNDASCNVNLLMDMGVTVLFNIDCTNLKQFRKQRFTKIIFNFPHVGLGIKNQDENILQNQILITKFFGQAKKILEIGGQIIITIKGGKPYDLWNVKQLGKDSGLKLVRSMEFCPSDYPGYVHRRTIGHDPQKSSVDNQEITKVPSRTFIFSIYSESSSWILLFFFNLLFNKINISSSLSLLLLS